MRKEWKGLGRLVKCPSTGYYLAIVPQEWKRDEDLSGLAPIAPESVQLEGYKAHFFYQEQNTVIGFITANGERIRLESGGPRFQLVGREIDDASEDMGPLFGEQPPSIGMIAEQGWSDVGVIVVGEEGGGQNRWRMQFVPRVGAEEQKLPEEIVQRRGGWYFVLIYDNNDDLLESMDFRFLGGLKNIRMGSFDCLPGPNGHDNVSVQFFHQTDCKPELADENIQHALEIRRERGQTIVTVPPKSDCDKTHWIFRDGDAEVGATVLVERIWWAFGIIGASPTDWLDKPITLSRKDFTAITGKTLWVRLPRLRFVRKIDVGFDCTKSRSYQVEVDKKEVAIPLRDFCDAEEIENRQEEARMMIWVQLERAKPDETVVVKVPADQPPPLKQKQQEVQKFILKEEKIHLLRANVKCQGGKRKGKGFSRKEVTKAGIAIEDVKHLHIPYDNRRRTSHSWNIKDLKYITER
jgi:ribosomal protein L13E